jgi:uncharacterized protein YegL
MKRTILTHRSFIVSVALVSVAAAWWGCAASTDTMSPTTSSGGTGGTSTTTTTSSSSGTGAGGFSFDGGQGGGDTDAACTSTSAAAHHIPLDIVFLLDQSGSMQEGEKWTTVSTVLPQFFNDPAQDGIGAGMLFFPYSPWDCDLSDYENLTVPLADLPANAFNLTNAIPATALGVGTPTYPALQGALMQATAYQDANPTHKVIVVLTTDGDPNGCDGFIPDIAGLASGALNYDGVQTYVIGVPGATIANLDQIAFEGGTTSAYDVTNDISQFSSKIAQIRQVALGCDFPIPPPPAGQTLNPADVNFSYTPNGSGMPTTLLRVNDAADCNNQPGWYYDNNAAPTVITLCPASCSTVQSDPKGEVNVLFGCKSIFK